MLPRAEYFLNMAVEEGRRGFRKDHGGPFGAVIVKNGRVVSESHNTAIKSKNSVQHAEINAIFLASKKLQRHHLKGCVLYSSTEPCPMCFSAIHWAKIRKVYFGTSIGDVAKLGFNELSISNKKMKRMGGSSVKLANGMRSPCLDLLHYWKDLPWKKTY